MYKLLNYRDNMDDTAPSMPWQVATSLVFNVNLLKFASHNHLFGTYTVGIATFGNISKITCCKVPRIPLDPDKQTRDINRRDLFFLCIYF